MKSSVSRMNLEQQKILVELGLRLKQARQHQGITLEHIAAKTLVSVRLLQAIESANFVCLPEPVYVQGFLKRYADAMGFNGAAFAAEFPTYVVPKVRALWRLSAFHPQLKPSHLYLAYLGIVATAVSGLSMVINRPLPETLVVPVQSAQPLPASPLRPAGAIAQGPVAPGAITPGAITPGTVAQPLLGPAGVATIPSPVAQGTGSFAPNSWLSGASAADDKLRVGLTVTDPSWVKVVADGKTAFEGELTQGAKRTWSVSKQVTVTAGNAGGVLVSLNDGQAKPLGAPGDVKEVTFPNATNSSKEQAGVKPPLAVSSSVTGEY